MKITSSTPIHKASAEYETAILGATALCQTIKNSGRIDYCINGNSFDSKKQYNQLRHAGTLWAMLTMYDDICSSKDVAANTKRDYLDKCKIGIKYLLKEHTIPTPENGGLCIKSRYKVKIGGCGLAILALIAIYRIDPNEYYLKQAKKFARHICDEIREDGDFHHFRLLPDWRVQNKRSGYYTGEALYALLELYRETRATEYLDVVKRSISQLKDRDYGVLEQSHWMLYALNALHKIDQDYLCYQYAEKIIEHILEHRKFMDGLYCTRMACLSEGILQFLEMYIRGGYDESDKTVIASIRLLELLLKLQRQSQATSGLFAARPGGEFYRPDYTQHNIAAYFGYFLLVKQKSDALERHLGRSV